MKRLNNIYIWMLASLLVFACEDELVEKAVLSPEVAANALNSPSEASYTLIEDQAAAAFDTFEWSATDFGYDASVIYTLQMDLTANQFAEPVTLVTTYDLTASPTIGQINGALLNKGEEAESTSEVSFRVVSSIHEEVPTVNSNTETVEVVSFAPSVITPLYIVGDDNGWSLDTPLELMATELGEYEVIGQFGNGNIWRFFEELDWTGKQFGASEFELDENLSAVGDGDDNFRFEAATGIYQLNVSLNDMTITVEAVDV